MKPVISVIMPVYNAVKYIEATVNSVLTQTFEDFELILVDDGSTDGSGKLCDVFAKRDDRIRVFHKENGGVSTARNQGIRHAEGEYIAFIDHDDCYLPDFLEKMLSFIRVSHVQMVKCGRINIRMAENVQYSEAFFVKKSERMDNSEFAKRYWRFRKNKLLLTAVWNGLYRRDFIEKHHITFPEEMRYGSEDTLFNYKMFLAGTDIAFLSDILYVHYIREGQSTSADFHIELFPDHLKLADLERRFISREAPEELSLLSYFEFYDCMNVLSHLKGRERKKMIRIAVSQIPLKECPLKYLFRNVGIWRMFYWMFFWLHIYQVFFLSYRLRKPLSRFINIMRA